MHVRVALAQHPFRVVFGVLALASLVPIWSVRYPPLPDLGAHVAAVSIWHYLHDPAHDFAQYYSLKLGPNPYWGFYFTLHLLSYVFGLELATHVVLSAYVVGLPVGMTWLARRFGRSEWLGLLAFPVIWTFTFNIGFLPCAFGIAFVPFALAAFDAFCERRTIARGAWAALAGVASYFFHPVAWGMFFSAAGLIGLLHRERSPRRLLGRFVVWAPSFVTGVLVTLYGRGKGVGSHHFAVSRVSTWTSLVEFYDWVWNNCTGHEDELFVALLAVGWLALLVTARGARLKLHELRAEACLLTALVAYFVLPRSLHQPVYWWGLNVRYATLAVLFATLCVPGEIAGARRWLLVPVVAAGLGFAVDTTVHWRRANAFCAGFDELAKIPKTGDRVLFVIEPPWNDPSVRQSYAQIYPGWYQAFHGGYLGWGFDDGFPFRYRRRYPVPEWHLMNFDWERHARYYDYVMVFQGQWMMFAGHLGQVQRIGAAGKWELWKLPGPRVDDPPGPAYPSGWAFDPNWRPSPSP